MQKSIIILILIVICNGSGQNKFNLFCDKKLLHASLDSALSQVGIIEKTDRNDGEVEKYLKLFGLKSGQPYCAAGLYWCFYTTSKDLNLPPKNIPIPKDPSAYGIFEFAMRYGKKTGYEAEKHDLIVWRSKISRRGHIERVFKIFGQGKVMTIGFNTVNKKTGKQGVFIHKRNIYHPLGRLMIKGLVGFNVNP